MNISNIGHNFPTSSVQSGKNVPHQTALLATDSIDNPSSTEKTIDMRNVSINEINELIKSGVDGLLDVHPGVDALLNIHTNDINQYEPEYANNIKVDFIDQIETSIEFKKSRGEETAFLEKVLENIKKIDGTKMRLNVDVTV